MEIARFSNDVLVPFAENSNAERHDTLDAHKGYECERSQAEVVVRVRSDSAILQLERGSRHEDSDGPDDEPRDGMNDLSLLPEHYEVPVGGVHDEAEDEPRDPSKQTM